MRQDTRVQRHQLVIKILKQMSRDGRNPVRLIVDDFGQQLANPRDAFPDSQTKLGQIAPDLINKGCALANQTITNMVKP